MKRMHFAAALLAFVWVACKNRDEIKVKDGKVSLPDAVKAAQKMGEEVKKSQGRWEERKAKGDTAALPYKELETYLPDVSGYTKDGGPQGSQMSMGGFGNFSETSQRYENGDKKIRIKIVDWNNSQTGLMGATAAYRMGFSFEDDNKKQGPVDLGVTDVAAYETIYKKRNDLQLAVVAGDRFIIEIDADNSSDIDELKSIAKNIVSGLSSRF